MRRQRRWIEVEDAVELCLNSVISLPNTGTLELRGTVQDQAVIILIDCVTTHNFIAQKVVEEMSLALLETANYGVIIGTKTSVRGRGVCKGVVLNVVN